jgi:hypothetical protein
MAYFEQRHFPTQAQNTSGVKWCVYVRGVIFISGKFVSLQVGMKNVCTSLTAILMVVWYSLSVIGFDVHTCSGSGETYIATVASGFTCEDIHPGPHGKTAHHNHACCGCCHSEKSETADPELGLDKNPCCTDDFQVILLTGTRGADEQRYSEASPQIYNFYVAEELTINPYSNLLLSDSKAFSGHYIGDIVSHNLQAVYNIWRI